MSIPKQTPDKRKSTEAETSLLKNLFRQVRALPQKKFLLASILLHLLFFSLLFMHWDNTEPAKALYIPSNIQAHVVNPETLKALQSNKETEQLANEKKAAELKRKAQLEKQKAKEDALKKAAEKKRAEREKLKIKKQKEEKEKLEKARLEKQKQLEEEKKAAELARQKELAEKLKAEKSKEIQEKEQKMLEMLKRMEQQALAKQQAELEAEQSRQQQAFQAYELTEIERFMALIKLRIENLWRIPPKSDNLSITLRIKLLPNGELSSVEVVKSSGSSAFDRSAILATKSVSRYPVPDDTRIFEKNFRQFNMAFKPETN